MNPLLMPDTPSGIAKVKLELERIDYAAPELSGRQGGVQAGWPLWMATYEIDRSDSESADLWYAFFDRLRGRQRLFIGGDPTRNFPKATPAGFGGLNRAGGGAFPGSATSWSQSFDADGNAYLTLAGLPAGFVLSNRDLIGFRWDASGYAGGNNYRRTMARVVLPAAASGAGAVTVMVEPPVDPLVVPAGSTAHFDNPRCLMRQLPDKSGVGSIGTGSAMGSGAIVAIQDLRP